MNTIKQEIRWSEDAPRIGVVQSGRYVGCFVSYSVTGDRSISLQLLDGGSWRTITTLEKSKESDNLVEMIKVIAESLFKSSSIAYRYAGK